MTKTSLYLAGGGARGAYQAGALKAVAEILQVKTIPFSMVSGVSIGSINAAIIAQHADDFALGVEKLISMWNEIRCQKVFNTSNYELGKSMVRNIGHLILKQRQSGHLLDTTPSHHLINNHIDFSKINEHIEAGHLQTLEVITNCYETQQTVSFYQHKGDFEDWAYPRHISQKVEMDIEFLLASGALPLFFPTVNINGFHYGDGSIGLASPLRGAIRFNMGKILILGTRCLPTAIEHTEPEKNEIGFSQILGTMLNGLFLDNLDSNIEMVNRMNEIAELISLWKKRKSPWRPIETLHLRPSVPLAEIAEGKHHSMPALLRFMLSVMGPIGHSGDLLSFLLFEAEFARELIELGYKDTLSNADQVEEFFS